MKNTIVVKDGASRPSFFGFDIMITPVLIKVWFVVALIGCVAGGIWLCWKSLAGETPEPFRAAGVWSGTGPLKARSRRGPAGWSGDRPVARDELDDSPGLLGDGTPALLPCRVMGCGLSEQDEAEVS